MNKTPRLKFKKGDLLAIVSVIALSITVAVAFLPQAVSPQDAVVQIYQDEELVNELPLQTDQALHLSGTYHNTVEIRDGRVAITESDCPGADCVHSGWISSAGRSIVCLPNRVEVRIVGSADVDFVVR